MPTINRKFTVTTDAEGAFATEQIINPPGPFGFTVELTATLTEPADTTISGKLDSDAVDGKPRNDAKDFTVRTGETSDLGEWQLDGGDNLIRLAGLTEPARAETELVIEITAGI
ncbi:MAG TPA: hypothetical protein VNB22_12700 [Pyrinomonadaceae bacterium]|nr:hypothetical protein [Pyrinomonadaceae bacterium]